MAKHATRARRSSALPLLVVIETTVVGLVAMGVFALLVDQYDHAQSILTERTSVAHATAFYIAMLTATPPTPTPTNTSTMTPTPTNTSTPTPTSTSTPTLSPTPTRTFTPRPPTRTPRPTLPPVPTVPPTPRPPTLVPMSGIGQCGTIDKSGNYRLGNDLTANGECIKIAASNVLLDCNGHAIRGTNFTGYGVGIHKYGLLNSQTPTNVEVRNCRVSNFRYGIYAEAGDHLSIHNNDSSNNYDDTDPATRFGIFLGMSDGGGIRLTNATSSQVFQNTTLHQGIGVDIRYSSGISVRNNTSSDNSAWGINFLRTQNSEAVGNTTNDNVRKCTWGAGTVGYGCDAGGIVVQDGSNGNTIANNTVTGRNGNGIFIKAHALPCGNNNTITGNTINSVLYNAVEFGFCTGNKVNSNQMNGGLDGVWLGFAHNNEIKNNTIVGMRNHGIISSNSNGTTVSGNQIISSNEGVYFYTEDYDHAAYAFLPPGDYTSHDNCLCGNTFQSNSIAVHLMNSTNNQVTNNIYQNNGRTFLVQGNGSGNNLQGFLDGNGAPWIPSLIAFRFPVR